MTLSTAPAIPCWSGSTPAMAGVSLSLPGELVWASTWMAEANEVLAPRLGLPVLPVVDWPDTDEEPQHGVHWKTAPHAAR